MENKMKFIDLFSGIGGFHQALQEFGECIMASEIDEKCRKNYERNYNLKPLGDIKNIKEEDIGDFDILTAGYPCQPFSKSGHQDGFEDDRGKLFFEICRIARFKKPKYMILENVKNLRTHDNGNTWNVMRKEIEKVGYFTYKEPIVLDARYYGIPQCRERVVILCKRNDLGELPEYPVLNSSNIKNTSLKDIIDDEKYHAKYKIKGKLKITEKIWDNFIKILIENNIDIPKYPIWTDWWDGEGEGTTVTKRDSKKSDEENEKIIRKRKDEFYKKYKKWIDSNRGFYEKNKEILDPWLHESRNKSLWKGAVRKLEWQAGDIKPMNKVLWSARGSGVRVKNCDYAPTLVAMASMLPVYGPLSKIISPRECARLQSFSEDTILEEDDKISYKQFGNAVNVEMIRRAARFLIFNEPLVD